MSSSHLQLQSPSQVASHEKFHHPYFTPAEVEALSEKQRGKLPASEEKLRQQACSFIDAVSVKMGFPRKTIATAQSLYHRFHLFFHRKDFNYIDVTLACLYVSTKLNDTLKKPRDILMVSYSVRFPELAARSKAVGGEVEMDPAIVEQDRQHLLGIERLVLETVCFNFTVRMPFPYVFKFGREFQARKRLIRLAWRLTADSYRTLAPLMYPPHVLALASLYLASLVLTFECAASGDDENVRKTFDSNWRNGSHHQARLEDLEEICHCLLDLLIFAAQSTSTTTSPKTPASPSSHISTNSAGQILPFVTPAPSMFSHDRLMRIKIHLRETEHPAQPRGIDNSIDAKNKGDRTALGRNEGTVRFMFGPSRVVGNAV